MSIYEVLLTFNDLTGLRCIRWEPPNTRLAQGRAGAGPVGWYLHIERLPGWPLSFGFDDREDLIALQKRTTDIQ